MSTQKIVVLYEQDVEEFVGKTIQLYKALMLVRAEPRLLRAAFNEYGEMDVTRAASGNRLPCAIARICRISRLGSGLGQSCS